MGWLKSVVQGLSGGDSQPVVPRVRGLAAVAPASTFLQGETFDDNTDTGGLSLDESHWIDTSLTVISAEDGLAIPGGLQKVRAKVPYWLMVVLRQSGTNEELAGQLPAAVVAPVLLDATTRTIVELDVQGLETELASYRAVVAPYFKKHDSYLAPFRNAAAAPGDALKAGKGMASAWKDALKDLAADAKVPAGTATGSSWSAADVEAMRRNATILALRWQNKPKERDRARASALQALPLGAANVRAGSLSAADFDVLVMREEVSTAITGDEATAYRREAGLGG